MSNPNHGSTRLNLTRRNRLQEYDYSNPGHYFVTICSHNRHHYFGSISNDHMYLSPAGTMIEQVIAECDSHFDSVSVDAFVVMPNHIHVLIGIDVRLSNEQNNTSLIDVIHWLKSTTHQRYRAGIRNDGWSRYEGAVWQEGYHDHIVRNEREFDAIQNYVLNNVERWEKDTFYDGYID